MRSLGYLLIGVLSPFLFDLKCLKNGAFSPYSQSHSIEFEIGKRKEKQKRKKRKYNNKKYKKRQVYREKQYKFRTTDSKDKRYNNQKSIRMKHTSYA